LDPQLCTLENNNHHNNSSIMVDHQDKNGQCKEETKERKTANQLLQSLLVSGQARQSRHIIHLSYADWTAEEVLRRLLPVTEIPSAFEVIGRLAHVNLRDELLPYKYIIGKVLLDKNTPRIQTIVNKIGSIETQYRTFGMEVIAGNDKVGWSKVLVKEEGCRYELDFQRVYWNSRLGGEHRRLVQAIREDAANRINNIINTQQKDEHGVNKEPLSLVVADMMAGIGPFAVPLTASSAKDDNPKQLPITVHANDLNPASYEYLEINAKANRCKHLFMYNLDARTFCHHLQDKGIRPDHYIMNLPATAMEFLDAFRGYKTNGDDDLPRIHVHCFAPKNQNDAYQHIFHRAQASLGCVLDKEADRVSIHLVRDVAPNKNMYCVSFRLPKAVQELPRVSIASLGAEPETKKRKKDNDISDNSC
jgi:tRNA (guanine37-N1)-methyltransferase